MSELRDQRLDRLEEEVRDIRGTLARLEPMIIAIHAQLPHLATKAELADKPNRAYLWGVMAAMAGAQAVALAAAALVFAFLQAHPAHAAEQPSYSCRLYYDEQRRCASDLDQSRRPGSIGSCDQQVERLKKECLRDGGRP